MRFRFLASATLTLTLVVTPLAVASPECCDNCGMKESAGCDMPCCDHKTPTVADALDVLLTGLVTTPPQFNDMIPARQRAVVWFDRPVWVGRNVLLGKYVIEHDTDRQARGEPCTHIYAAEDLKTPVVTFHCTHLHGEQAARATVVLGPAADGARKLLQFQFAGETAAHGYPSGR